MNMPNKNKTALPYYAHMQTTKACVSSIKHLYAGTKSTKSFLTSYYLFCTYTFGLLQSQLIIGTIFLWDNQGFWDTFILQDKQFLSNRCWCLNRQQFVNNTDFHY